MDVRVVLRGGAEVAVEPTWVLGSLVTISDSETSAQCSLVQFVDRAQVS